MTAYTYMFLVQRLPGEVGETGPAGRGAPGDNVCN